MRVKTEYEPSNLEGERGGDGHDLSKPEASDANRGAGGDLRVKPELLESDDDGENTDEVFARRDRRGAKVKIETESEFQYKDFSVMPWKGRAEMTKAEKKKVARKQRTKRYMRQKHVEMGFPTLTKSKRHQIAMEFRHRAMAQDLDFGPLPQLPRERHVSGPLEKRRRLALKSDRLKQEETCYKLAQEDKSKKAELAIEKWQQGALRGHLDHAAKAEADIEAITTTVQSINEQGDHVTIDNLSNLT